MEVVVFVAILLGIFIGFWAVMLLLSLLLRGIFIIGFFLRNQIVYRIKANIQAKTWIDVVPET